MNFHCHRLRRHRRHRRRRCRLRSVHPHQVNCHNLHLLLLLRTAFLFLCFFFFLLLLQPPPPPPPVLNTNQVVDVNSNNIIIFASAAATTTTTNNTTTNDSNATIISRARPSLPFLDALIRLILSLFVGGVVGFEREWRNITKSRSGFAGLRTHALVATSACLLQLISIYAYADIEYAQLGDPSRLAAQTVSGIGFIGAGAIMKQGSNLVVGLTTAASIWSVMALGLAIGAGYTGPAIASLGLTLVCLEMLKLVSKYMRSRHNYLVSIRLQAARQAATEAHFDNIEHVGYEIHGPNALPAAAAAAAAAGSTVEMVTKSPDGEEDAISVGGVTIHGIANTSAIDEIKKSPEDQDASSGAAAAAAASSSSSTTADDANIPRFTPLLSAVGSFSANQVPSQPRKNPNPQQVNRQRTVDIFLVVEDNPNGNAVLDEIVGLVQNDCGDLLAFSIHRGELNSVRKMFHRTRLSVISKATPSDSLEQQQFEAQVPAMLRSYSSGVSQPVISAFITVSLFLDHPPLSHMILSMSTMPSVLDAQVLRTSRMKRVLRQVPSSPTLPIGSDGLQSPTHLDRQSSDPIDIGSLVRAAPLDGSTGAATPEPANNDASAVASGGGGGDGGDDAGGNGDDNGNHKDGDDSVQS